MLLVPSQTYYIYDIYIITVPLPRFKAVVTSAAKHNI